MLRHFFIYLTVSLIIPMVIKADNAVSGNPINKQTTFRIKAFTPLQS